MQILEVYNDAGVMTAKLRVDKKKARWFYWECIPLGIVVYILLQVW